MGAAPDIRKRLKKMSKGCPVPGTKGACRLKLEKKKKKKTFLNMRQGGGRGGGVMVGRDRLPSWQAGKRRFLEIPDLFENFIELWMPSGAYGLRWIMVQERVRKCYLGRRGQKCGPPHVKREFG